MYDINAVDGIQSIRQLFAAYEETYNNEENVSSAYVFEVRATLKSLAPKFNCVKEFDDFAAELDRSFDDKTWVRELYASAELTNTGGLRCTTDNFLCIMRHDPAYRNIKYNELTGMPETVKGGKVVAWTDADDAASRCYIEKEYKIYSRPKHDEAIELLLCSRSYHPIKQKIESTVWDGQERIAMLLHNCLDIEDTPYTREVSRLIFAGGINRLYRPGCKFDDMPVLIGKQGGGKSTFVRWLAMDDKFFTELKTIEGKEGAEAVNGAWIVEVSELLALTKTKEQEAVKAYLSTLVDKYRPAYAKRSIVQPRTCVFVGTTNRDTFISDKTGGRRFYPVTCVRTGYDLFRREEEVRGYIEQCWAEAYAKIDTPFMAAYAFEVIRPDIEAEQAKATEDDYRVGMIERYLETCGHTKICFGQLWESALEYGSKMPERADQTQIGLIMRSMEGWERCDWKNDFGKYGKQKFWRKKPPRLADEVTFTTSNDDIPF